MTELRHSRNIDRAAVRGSLVVVVGRGKRTCLAAGEV
jgi:hypothetical protein